MIISIIAAISKNKIIGNKNSMLWNIPEDLIWFKRKTIYNSIIMGRKTFESIGKKPLPERKNIVLSRKRYIKENNNILLANSPIQALSFAKKYSKKEIFIIGGGEIYRIFLPITHRLYLTHIEMMVHGDIQFPEYRKIRRWFTIYRTIPTNFNDSCRYYFEILERSSSFLSS